MLLTPSLSSADAAKLDRSRRLDFLHVKQVTRVDFLRVSNYANSQDFVQGGASKHFIDNTNTDSVGDNKTVIAVLLDTKAHTIMRINKNYTKS